MKRMTQAEVVAARTDVKVSYARALKARQDMESTLAEAMLRCEDEAALAEMRQYVALVQLFVSDGDPVGRR